MSGEPNGQENVVVPANHDPLPPIRLDAQPSKSAIRTPSSLDSERIKRNISWQDFHGKELYTVIEYEPSETDDSDGADGGEMKKCCVLS